MSEKIISQLVQELEQAKHDYYHHGTARLSDAEFDEKEQQLRLLSPQHHYFSEVGSAVSGSKISHLEPMLSLAKVRNFAELDRWQQRLQQSAVIANNTPLLVQPKIDGLSATCLYRDGRLVYVATRGDGSYGQNISHVADYIDDIPATIDFTDEIEIRGELYLPKDCQLTEKYFRLLRNSCVGLINRKENREDLRQVRFVSYQTARQRLNLRESEQLRCLANLGFHTVEYLQVNDLESVKQFFQLYLQQLRDRWPYETDGLVLSIDDSELFAAADRLWKVDHHHHYSVAIKPPAEQAPTNLLEIEWSISRQGNLIPVAVFAAIELKGARLQRASLHNYKNVVRLALRPGDKLLVARSNDVIPYVLANLSSSIGLSLHCPACGGMLDWQEGNCYCFNGDCPAPVVANCPAAITSGDYTVAAVSWVRNSQSELLLQLQFAETTDRTLLSAKELSPLQLRLFDRLSLQRHPAAISNRSCAALPQFCPGCQGRLIANGVHLHCSDRNCRQQVIQRCLYWVQRAGIVQVSQRTIERLFNEKLLSGVSDLYRLQLEQLLSLKGFASKNAANIIEQIEQSRSLSVVDFICRLGVPLLQQKSIADLAVLILLHQFQQHFFAQLCQSDEQPANQDSDWQRLWQEEIANLQQRYWDDQPVLSSLTNFLATTLFVRPASKISWSVRVATCQKELKRKLLELDLAATLPFSFYRDVDNQLAGDAVIAANWVDWLADTANIALIDELLPQLSLTISAPPLSASDQPAVVVALTGKGPYPRQQIVAELEKLGFSYSPTVDNKVKILLSDNSDGSGKKLQRARQQGLLVLSYQEFFASDLQQLRQRIADNESIGT